MIELLIVILFITYFAYYLFLEKPSNFPPGRFLLQAVSIVTFCIVIFVSNLVAKLYNKYQTFTGPPSLPFVGSLPFLPKVDLVLAFGADWIIERYFYAIYSILNN